MTDTFNKYSHDVVHSLANDFGSSYNVSGNSLPEDCWQLFTHVGDDNGAKTDEMIPRESRAAQADSLTDKTERGLVQLARDTVDRAKMLAIMAKAIKSDALNGRKKIQFDFRALNERHPKLKSVAESYLINHQLSYTSSKDSLTVSLD